VKIPKAAFSHGWARRGTRQISSRFIRHPSSKVAQPAHRAQRKLRSSVARADTCIFPILVCEYPCPNAPKSRTLLFAMLFRDRKSAPVKREALDRNLLSFPVFPAMPSAYQGFHLRMRFAGKSHVGEQTEYRPRGAKLHHCFGRSAFLAEMAADKT
jgi:hypothetical protein